LSKVVQKLELHKNLDISAVNTNNLGSDLTRVNATAVQLQPSLVVLAQRDSYLYKVSVILPNAG